MAAPHDMHQVVYHGEHVQVCRACKKQPNDPTFAEGCSGAPVVEPAASGNRMGTPVLAESAESIPRAPVTPPRTAASAQVLDADAIEDEIARHEGEIARLKVLLKRAQARRKA